MTKNQFSFRTYSILFLGIVVILFGAVQTSRRKRETFRNREPTVSNFLETYSFNMIRNKITQMVIQVHKMLRKHKVTYFMDGNLLASAIREGRISVYNQSAMFSANFLHNHEIRLLHFLFFGFLLD